MPSTQTLIEALASQAAVCVERTRLLEAQQQLIDSMITLLAGAIDAKSRHTGGTVPGCRSSPSCSPRAADEEEEGPLAAFRFRTPDEWREFRIGAWLHDCGKVTTPEYVVDKATKLETNYNRIHEIRTRFEVLLRDAQIARLESLLAGADPQEAEQRFAECRSTLQEEFAFLASSNLGGEFFPPEKVERLRQSPSAPGCAISMIASVFPGRNGSGAAPRPRRRSCRWREPLLATSPGM